MWRKKPSAMAVALLGLIVLVTLTRYFIGELHQRGPGGSHPDHAAALGQIAEQYDSAQVAAEYQPSIPGRLDDLTIPAEALVRGLPGVVGVEVAVSSLKPTHRIVQLRDWHFVPRDLYAGELLATAGRALTEAEIDRRHDELCLSVEAVQREQMALLRCLIKHHGLRLVHSEGLTEKDLPNFREKVAVLRAMEQEQIPKLRKQLAEARELKNGAAVVKEIEELLEEHGKRLLELGAAGRLLIAGEIEDVLPLDDAERLEQAKPQPATGRLAVAPEKLAARHDAIVRAATADGPLAVIVLGASHDLTASVYRVGGGGCEYIRVTTKQVRQFADAQQK